MIPSEPWLFNGHLTEWLMDLLGLEQKKIIPLIDACDCCACKAAAVPNRKGECEYDIPTQGPDEMTLAKWEDTKT